MSEAPYPVLEARQLRRIEAVCGDFLDQYLYAVKPEEIMDRDEDYTNE